MLPRYQVSREVALTRRGKTPQDLRFCPVVISAHGRVKPDYVLIGGKEQRHPERAYYLVWNTLQIAKIIEALGKNGTLFPHM